MARKVASTTTLVAVTVLLLCTAFFVAAVTAAGPASASSAQKSQRQRIHSIATYAQRVGAALDLFVGGHSIDEDGDVGVLWQSFVEPQYANPSVGLESVQNVAAASPLTGAMQFLRYPHIAVEEMTRSVMKRARAAATLVSVVLGGPHSEDADALLAKMKTGSDLSMGATVTESPRLASLRSTRETTPAALKISTAPQHATQQRQILLKTINRKGEAQNWQPGEVPPLTCRNGLNAVSSDAIVECRNSVNTYSAAAYAQLSPVEREECDGFVSNDGPLTQTCVCAQDYYMSYIDEDDYSCQSRPLDVQVVLEREHECFSRADAALGMPGSVEGEYCVKTARNSTLQLPVQWKYRFLSDDDMLAASVFQSLRTPPQVPPGHRSLRWVVMNSTSGPAMGTYSELSMNTNLFSYVVAGHADAGLLPTSQRNVGFYLSSNTELLSASSFLAVFCFASPRKTKDQLREVPLKTTEVLKEYLGSADGITSHSLTLDLSTVPDDYVEGNQMYVEAGLRGGPSIYYYRVAHIHIAFTDLPEPHPNAHRYPKQFNPLYILLIAAVGAGVAGTGAAVLWYHCMEDEDDDDRFVSDAQRKTAQKRQPGASGG
ncbi:hypothetical protein LSCM1_07654 [Leishmania martiniquensis]|uniref:Uncharacterized protein n=1 Tax=Leishmania martiniquensis TaxID=1580590 RepID=A0A836HK33_9TRYP|nr:hypothetical protein LSCM1_07654 [Leishmania martiniquensis]